ncbi:four helix bundle protein [Chryseobacterium sp. POL2]|uniref:four helix bundle protein n=1 Tax=Chryseobacterium sp. POL2 TaxID=2713414 RepID=UPI0013E18BE6|nr:four helix bundle protein [Chryseobacterium sp. POL2]QIG89853.1 four helix bundle protein [Chryseobacterium sp. POL2]
MKENVILKKTFDFSLNVIKYCELLHGQKKFVISNQLLRSGTSIGANTREAQNSESKNDFIHKFKIAAKEIEETNYWLLLCQHSESYPNCEDLIQN